MATRKLKKDHETLMGEWTNASTVEIDDEGACWIEGPGRGHWLTDSDVEEFFAWLDSRKS